MARYPQKIGLWGVRGAEEYCYRLDFAPALLSVRREGAIGWKPDIIPLSNLLRCYAKEGANKQVISSQADSLIKISRIWADF
ncbi:hypothetical protein, partial [Klebsiella pneumoniae]|uniref:hypothetical protein n=2 Tax=Klebsiella pneumoniae TaxID=573 RepID=UPI001C8AF205